jgi:MFS transporter, PPP family, 3-phenylpropionic acid transporter
MKPHLSIASRFRLFFAFDFAAIGIFFPFMALYLASIGLSGGQVGILLAVIPLTRFLVQPVWGAVSDIYHLHRHVLALACIGLAGASALLGLTTDFGLLLPLMVIISTMQAPISPLGTALALEHLERSGRRDRFGSLRLWGSIGFAVMVFVIGAAFVEDAVWLIIPCYALTAVMLGVIALTLPAAEIHLGMNWRAGIALVAREHALLRFLAGGLLVGATLGVVNSYFTVYMTDIRASGWVIGVALAVSALGEVPLMAMASASLARWGLRLVLVGGIALLPVRWLLYTVIEEPILVIPTQVIHSIAIMSLFVVGVIYVDQQLARAWRATGQGLYAAALHGIGPSIGLLGAGFVYERAGIQPVWLACAVVALMGVLTINSAMRSPLREHARGTSATAAQAED